MSHELRTPLNSLLLLARLLADNPEHEPDRRSRSSSPAPSTAPAPTCSSLIDDILDLSKIEAGRMDVEPDRGRRSTEIRGYVEQAFAPQAEEKGLRASRSTSTPELPAAIVTDAQRLQQILRNLLSNAVKFTDSGSVTLRIGAGRRRARDFDVADAGRAPGRWSRSRSPTPASASPTTSWR